MLGQFIIEPIELFFLDTKLLSLCYRSPITIPSIWLCEKSFRFIITFLVSVGTQTEPEGRNPRKREPERG